MVLVGVNGKLANPPPVDEAIASDDKVRPIVGSKRGFDEGPISYSADECL